MKHESQFEGKRFLKGLENTFLQGLKQLFPNLLHCFQKARFLTGYFVEIDWEYWTKTTCNAKDIAGYSLQLLPIFNPILNAWCADSILEFEWSERKPEVFCMIFMNLFGSAGPVNWISAEMLTFYPPRDMAKLIAQDRLIFEPC